MNQKGFSLLIAILGISVTIFVLGGFYYLNNLKRLSLSNQETQQKKESIKPSSLPLGSASETFFDRVEKDMQKLATTSAPMESTSINPTNWSLPINLAICGIGEKRTLLHGLGSRSLEVIKSNRDNCTLKYVNEIEGGYTESECILPKSLGAISPPDESFQKYCKEVKSGNYLLER